MQKMTSPFRESKTALLQRHIRAGLVQGRDIFSLYTPFGRWSNQQEYVTMSLFDKFPPTAFEMIRCRKPIEFWGDLIRKIVVFTEMKIQPDPRRSLFSRPDLRFKDGGFPQPWRGWSLALKKLNLQAPDFVIFGLQLANQPTLFITKPKGVS